MEAGEAFAAPPAQTSGCECGVRARAGDGAFRLGAGTAKSVPAGPVLLQYMFLPRPHFTHSAHQFWNLP